MDLPPLTGCEAAWPARARLVQSPQSGSWRNVGTQIEELSAWPVCESGGMNGMTITTPTQATMSESAPGMVRTNTNTKTNTEERRGPGARGRQRAAGTYHATRAPGGRREAARTAGRSARRQYRGKGRGRGGRGGAGRSRGQKAPPTVDAEGFTSVQGGARRPPAGTVPDRPRTPPQRVGGRFELLGGQGGETKGPKPVAPPVLAPWGRGAGGGTGAWSRSGGAQRLPQRSPQRPPARRTSAAAAGPKPVPLQDTPVWCMGSGRTFGERSLRGRDWGDSASDDEDG